MTVPVRTDQSVSRAHGTGPASEAVASIVTTLRAELAGRPASVVLYFASADYSPTDLAGPLTAAFEGASVIGCSTAGEFTDHASGTHGVTAVALPAGIAGRHAAALGHLGNDAAAGTSEALRTIETELGTPLRDLDPETWVGFVLIDGMHGAEEVVNEQIGNAAPLLNVVGGSAGDDLAFERTWVAVGDQVSWQGVAFVIAEVLVPFEVVKTCSFTPTGTVLRITKADVATRTVWEFDGRPALDVYAESLGLATTAVDASAFLEHPVGLMVDGVPFIRSPQQIVEGGGIRFYCQILEGMDVELMQGGDLVADTAAAVSAARESLGTASGAVYFNCILRRLELDALDQTEPFVDALGGIPSAGFHTYGETWLGHINQTLTGVVFA
ncbi:FIST signal transduction protein [Cellulomonas sp. KRMCY2]|uniref:FIST signal transduction protein n=1 Tax=Cellulomonas sp. KRMCY2 TaxID=1304865 RepID=UPI00045E7F9F|nr:FIST N-terminal domain-containing protein [Cellulomonas sp. KRMCY2]